MVITCRTKVSRHWAAFTQALTYRARSNLTTSNESTWSNSSAENNSNIEEPIRRHANRSRRRDSIREDAEDSSSPKFRENKASFDNMINDQIDRARRSILVRFIAKSPHAFADVYSEICKQLRSADVSVVANESSLFSSSPPLVHSPDGLKTFFLLETTTREPLDRFIQYSARSAGSDVRMQPCRTRILHFTGGTNGNAEHNSRASRAGGGGGDRIKTHTATGIDAFALNKALQESHWLDEQMRVLVDELLLTEYGVRLRFFVASLIEDAFRGIFPVARCVPFGSTVNGFGHSNCDVDMDFMPEDPSVTGAVQSNWLCAFRHKDDDPRKHTQYMIELLGRMVRSCMPYCIDVSRIVNARVPIVKFTHEAGGFGCDLTVDNATGLTFAKILWVNSRCDNRVCPLVFAVRRWAAACNITRDAPGGWFTNFQLLCLVVYFLQTRPSGAILPSISTLRRLAMSSERNGVIGDPERLKLLLRNERMKIRSSNSSSQDSKINQESVGDLLREFFYFYAYEFDFDRWGISLEEGAVVEKTDETQPVYIRNPLETDHNIAKNVAEKELERFRFCARTALKLMERKDLMEKKSAANRDVWGLLALFDSSLYENWEETVAPSPVEAGVVLVDKVAVDIHPKTAVNNRNEAGSNEKLDGDPAERSETEAGVLLVDNVEIDIHGKSDNIRTGSRRSRHQKSPATHTANL